MQRREFLRTAAAAALAAAPAPAAETGDYRFKLGMYLGELDLPFDEALAKAREIGAEYVWFNQLKGETPVGRMSDAESDRLAERVKRHDLKVFLLNAGNPFKEIHLTDLSAKAPEEHPGFRQRLADLPRSMETARRLGVNAVGCFTFAWRGEYSAGK